MGPTKEDTVKASVKAARVIASVDSFTIGKLTTNFGSMNSEVPKQGGGAPLFEGNSAAGISGEDASSHATATGVPAAAGNEAPASAGGDGLTTSSGSSDPAGASFPNPTNGDETTGKSPKKSKGGATKKLLSPEEYQAHKANLIKKKKDRKDEAMNNRWLEMIAYTEILAPVEDDFYKLLAELRFDGAPLTPDGMLAKVAKTIGKGSSNPRLVFWYFILWRDHNQILRDFLGSPAIFQLEEAKKPDSEEGLRMRKELRSIVDRLLLPSKNELKRKAKESKDAAAAKGGAATSKSKSTPDSISRRKIVRERLLAMGVGGGAPAAPAPSTSSSDKGKGGKRKASKDKTSEDAKKSKPDKSKDASKEATDDKANDKGTGTPSQVIAEAKALEEGTNDDLVVDMEISGAPAKKPYSEVAKVSHRPEHNPYTLEVTRYIEKGGKKVFTPITKKEWEEGIYFRVSQFLSNKMREVILKTARGEVSDKPYQVLNNYVNNGTGIIIPKDQRTCQWLSQEIIPKVVIKQAKLVCRLKPKKVVDHSKTTPMVRCTITLPSGWRTNGKDDFWHEFAYVNGLSKGCKFHECSTLKTNGQTHLAFYVTEDRAAWLWYPDEDASSGLRRAKTVNLNAGGSYRYLWTGAVSWGDKEFEWKAVTNSLQPIEFDESE